MGGRFWNLTSSVIAGELLMGYSGGVCRAEAGGILEATLGSSRAFISFTDVYMDVFLSPFSDLRATAA